MSVVIKQKIQFEQLWLNKEEKEEEEEKRERRKEVREKEKKKESPPSCPVDGSVLGKVSFTFNQCHQDPPLVFTSSGLMGDGDN